MSLCHPPASVRVVVMVIVIVIVLMEEEEGTLVDGPTSLLINSEEKLRTAMDQPETQVIYP